MGYEQRRPGRGRWTMILIALAVIILVVGTLSLYVQAPSSNTVYCGVLQFVEFRAHSISGSRTINVTQTLTTMIDYTTTTSVAGPVGHTFANSSTTVTSGYSAGVETICKYISNISASNSTSK
jgi:hypothetical protein